MATAATVDTEVTEVTEGSMVDALEDATDTDGTTKPPWFHGEDTRIDFKDS